MFHHSNKCVNSELIISVSLFISKDLNCVLLHLAMSFYRANFELVVHVCPNLMYLSVGCVQNCNFSVQQKTCVANMITKIDKTSPLFKISAEYIILKRTSAQILSLSRPFGSCFEQTANA